MPYFTPDDLDANFGLIYKIFKNLHIDVDDFYYEMSDREKEEMYDLLINDGYGKKSNPLDEPPHNLIEWEFQGIMEKIISNRLLLTSEEDEMLRKIASRF